MNCLYHLRRLLIIIFAVVYLLNYFYPQAILGSLYSYLLLIMVLIALPSLPKTNILVSFTLVLVGSILLAVNNASPGDWISSFAKNAGLVTIYLAIPLIKMPFIHADYKVELKHLAQRYMSNVMVFCLLIAVMAHILGAVIAIGSIPLLYELFHKNARLYNAELLFLAALTQGYATSGFWSPAWVSMAVVTQNIDISFIDVIPLGLPIAALTIGLSMLVIYMKTRRDPQRYRIEYDGKDTQVKWSTIYTIIALISSLLLMIILFDFYTNWQLLIIIPFVAIIFPPLAAFFQKKTPAYKAGMREYYNTSILNTKNETVLFTAAGFLGKSLEIAGVNQLIHNLLPDWLNQFPLFAILVFFLLMMIVALPGIHPVVTTTALISAVSPEALGLSTNIYAMTILCSWSTALLISPFSGLSLVGSGVARMPSWEFSMKINFVFSFIMAVVLSAVIALLALFI